MNNRSIICLVGNTTTGQNLGAGAGVFKCKSGGNNLQFRSISSTGTSIQIFQVGDKILVSGSTGGGTITGATNGLGVSGKNVCLGGTITTSTDISSGIGGVQNLSFGGVKALDTFYVGGINDVLLELTGSSAQLYLQWVNGFPFQGSCAFLTAKKVSLRTTSGSAVVTLSGSTVDITGNLRLLTTPADGSSNDSALVWNSTTGAVNKMPYSTGGSGITWSGNTANGVGTYASATCICSQPNMTFNGSILCLAGNIGFNCASARCITMGTTVGSAFALNICGNSICHTSAGASTAGGANMCAGNATGLTCAQGGPMALIAGNACITSNPASTVSIGGSFNINAGDGIGLCGQTPDRNIWGGGISLIAGKGCVLSGNTRGGDVTVYGGCAVGTSSTTLGGSICMSAGAGWGCGGNVLFWAGNANCLCDGGCTVFCGGCSKQKNGGYMNFLGGIGSCSGNKGGDICFTAGCGCCGANGGNVCVQAGLSTAASAGNFYIKCLPAKASEINVLYIDSAGKISSGVTSAVGSGIGWSNLANGSTVAGCGTYPTGTSLCENTFYGVCAGANTFPTGKDNVAIGYLSLLGNDTGSDNVGIGVQTLLNNVSGSSNIAIGSNALYGNSCGYCNIAIGDRAMSNSTKGCANIAIGDFAIGNANTTGSDNIAMGTEALRSNTTGGNNVAIGCNALRSNSTGSNNVAIGRCAGYSETGSNKLYIASGASQSLIYGEFDTKMVKICGCMCITALPAKTTETCGIYIDAGGKLSTGVISGGTGGSGITWTGSTADGVGTYASSTRICSEPNMTFNGTTLSVSGVAYASTCVCSSVICGTSCVKSPQITGTTAVCGAKVSAGCYQILGIDVLRYGILDSTNTNLMIGRCAGGSAGYGSFGINNIGIGVQAFNGVGGFGSGANNIAIGSNALYNLNAGLNNIAIGTNALYNNTDGCLNVALGCDVLCTNTTGCGNFGAGCLALTKNLTGINNFAFGCLTMCSNTTGNENIAMGSTVLYKNISGVNNIAQGFGTMGANTIGNSNVAIGFNSMIANVCGHCNIAIGNSVMTTNKCGCYNVAVGAQALADNTSGNTNIAIGRLALSSITIGCSNVGIGEGTLNGNATGCYNVAIGYYAGQSSTGNNKLYIGSGSTTLIYGEFDNKRLVIGGTTEIVNPVVSGACNYLYLGDKDTDGSWRFAVSGASMIIQRRVTGAYVTKQTIT